MGEAILFGMSRSELRLFEPLSLGCGYSPGTGTGNFTLRVLATKPAKKFRNFSKVRERKKKNHR